MSRPVHGNARRTLLAAPALGAFLLMLASCVQALGIEDLPGTCGAIAYASQECATCIDASCCAEVEACAASAACAPILGCRAACSPSDAACRIACGHSSDPVAVRLSACERQRCNKPCLACGAYGDAFGAECSSCFAKLCCDQSEASAARPGSDAFLDCFDACSDPACVFNCISKTNTEDLDVAKKLGACGVECDACKLGRHFDCVGKYSTHEPTAPTARYTVELRDLASKPVAGVSLEACSWTDVPCASPLSHAVTSPAGLATLELPLNLTSGFTGFIQADSELVNLLGLERVVDDLSERWLILDRTIAVAALQFVSGEYDPVHDGAVLFAGYDCLQSPAPGVVFELDAPFENERVYYQGADGTPSKSATATAGSGIAAAILHAPKGGLLPADHVSYRIRLVSTGEIVGDGAAPIRAGTLSQGTTRAIVMP